MDFKVYVALGFHINFYHSWRGDTPDAAGFGTDIRIVREIIRKLNIANAAGLKARLLGYRSLLDVPGNSACTRTRHSGWG